MTRNQNGPRPLAGGAAQGVLFNSERSATQSARQAPDRGGRKPDGDGSVIDGERRKLDALATLAARKSPQVREARTVMLRLLLERGECSIEDVRLALSAPPGPCARWLGAVPGELRRAGIIARVTYVESGRAVAHARPVSLWRLADTDAARAWLATNGGGGV